MKFNHTKIIHGAVFLVALFLSACGGGGGGGAAPPSNYTVGGTVSGLTGSVVLQDNNGDNLTVSANGGFTFATSITNGNTYATSVLTQPIGQICSVSTGAGTVSGSNVTNVAVVCSNNSYNVGGTVSGLTGTVVLQDNNGNNLTVSTNGTGTFTFATKVANGSPYSVTVFTRPTGQSCSVASGTGTIALANVTNVALTCATNTYTIGGTVTGLNGSMVLQDSGADSLTVAANGAFTFATAVNAGTTYVVTVLTQPVGQTCSVSTGAGAAAGNVTNVVVSCAGYAPAQPTVPLATTLSESSIRIDWTDNSSNELGFYVERSASATGPFTRMSVSANTLTYTDSGLSSSTLYYYRVAAYNASGISAYAGPVSATTSAPAVVVPSAPTNITITNSIASVNGAWAAVKNIAWTANGAASYNVYRSTTTGFAVGPATLVANTATIPYVDTGLVANTTYYYQVTAVNSAGESLPSVEKSTLTAPAIPTGVGVTPGTNKNTIAWSPVPGATSYNIHLSILPGTITNVTSPYTQAGLTNGTSYLYRVSAVNAGGESADSPWASATPLAGIDWTTTPGAWVFTAGGAVGYLLRDIAWNGTQFSIVADGGAIFTSPDGTTWTPQTSGTANKLFGITYGVPWNGGKFVAVGDLGTILTSPDGITWTSQTSWTTNQLLGAVWSGTQFVAVGAGGTVRTSPDGTGWNIQTSGTTNWLLGVTWGGTKFVAVGGLGTIITSPDGITWTARTSGTANNLRSIVWNGSQFVAVGDTGTILTSPDGYTWTVQTSGTLNTLDGISSGGGQFVAVGYMGAILTSPDGMTWTTRVSNTQVDLFSATWNGTKFVTTGFSAQVLTSP